MSEDRDGDARRIARSVLGTEECLLWSGRPDARRIAALQTLPIFILAAPWIAVVLYWTASSFAFRLPEFTFDSLLGIWPFFGLLVALFGLTLLALPWLAYRKATRTVYAITDRRCLIIIAGKRNYVDAYGQEDISAIKRIERRNGTGDLIFTASSAGAAKDLTRVGKAVFYGIPGVRQAEETARRAFGK
jgi:hypothetical protein